MQIGISTASCFLRLNNEDALPLFAEWKVPVAEVFLSSYSEYAPRFSEALARGKGDVRVHSVHVISNQFEPQLYAEHPRVRADAEALLDEVMRSARALGASGYTFHGIARFKRTFREDVARTARETARIAAFCARYGVDLCFENVEWAFYNRPGIFRALRAECPSLRGVLDVKQARISGYDYAEYLAEMGPSLSHVHVSDVNERGEPCLPGRGVTDFGLLFRRLADAGFAGPVFIENYARDFSSLAELKESFGYLTDLAARCGA